MIQLILAADAQPVYKMPTSIQVEIVGSRFRAPEGQTARILPVRLVLGNNSSSAVSGTDACDAGDAGSSLDTDRLPEYRN